jgi:acetyl-CoA carboxylase carboxyl transferase subunit alpha
MNLDAVATSGSPVTHLLEFEKPIAKMEHEIRRLEADQNGSGRDYSEILSRIREQLRQAIEKAYGNLTPWENVQVARHPQRPQLRDYIRLLCKDFCELHGDKLFSDDPAIVCGFARLADQRVMLIGHQKGRDTRERIKTNFGCAHPDGYRKALQKMRLAAKFHVPVVCLIDTPGAYPGVEAEERGIARAIAVNLMEMSRLPTPIVACVIGEGGSGGALGLAVADHVAVMQYAYYSVISPEGCAGILWRSHEEKARAAHALRLVPTELLRLNLIDSIVQEPLGGAHRDLPAAARSLEAWVSKTLREKCRLKIETLLKRRYDRFRSIGSFYAVTGDAPRAPETAPVRSKRRRTPEVVASRG